MTNAVFFMREKVEDNLEDTIEHCEYSLIEKGVKLDLKWWLIPFSKRTCRVLITQASWKK